MRAALTRWWFSTGLGGLPQTTNRELLAGRLIAIAATVWVLLVGVWGINGPFSEGHFASVANIGVGGLNMLRLHTIYPVFTFLDQTTKTATIYMNHPLGIFWVAALLQKVFGSHNWVLRLPAVIYVTFTAIFLYRTGRSIWGPLEGGVAALAYASLPITLGFANYHDLEQPVMLGCMVATWGYVRYRQTWATRFAVMSILGFVFAALNDWEAYIWAGTFLTFLFLRGFVVPESWWGRIDTRAFGRYWGLLAGALVAVLVVTLGLIVESGKLIDVLRMYEIRSAGNQIPLQVILQSRAVRIELMFTALGILLGKVGLLVVLIRFARTRNDLELMPLFLWVMAAAFYVIFKSGADVHIFWPHPFAIFFGLALAAILASLRQSWPWIAPRLSRLVRRPLPGPEAAPWIALVVLAIPLLLVFRDGASMIRFARETGGRFIEAQLPSEIDRAVVLRWFLASHATPNDKLALHRSVANSWATHWEVRPRPTLPNQPLGPDMAPGVRTYILDSRAAAVAELRQAATLFQVHVAGPFWLIDRREPKGPIQGYRIDARDPGLFESLAQGATEPVRKVSPDPWVTWEWRALLGQPAALPAAPPVTLDQVRIAHNAAVAGGLTANAGQLRRELLERVDGKVRARFDNKTELLGMVHRPGAQRGLTLYFVAGEFKHSSKFSVLATVTRRRFLSSLPVDPTVHDIAQPPAIPIELWRPGHIYAIDVVYRRRPGHEKLTGTFTPVNRQPAPVRTDGPRQPIDLLAF